MASFWNRKDKQKGGFPPPPASQEAGLGTHIQENGSKPWVEDAVSVEEEESARFCGIQRPRKGWQLSRPMRFFWQMTRLKDRSKQPQASQGAEESWRGAGMQAQAAERCTELELRLPEEPGTCQNAAQGAEGQQEEQVTRVTAFKVHSVISHHGGDGWDEPIVGNGDEEGRSTGSAQSVGLWVEDKDAATVPQGDGQDFNPPSAEGRAGEEQRRQVWEKLHRLGEDMARWEGSSTRDLAGRLVEVILQTKTEMYPPETGNEGDWWEQGEARARVRVPIQVGAVWVTHADATTANLRNLVTYQHVSSNGTVYENDEHLPAMPELFGNEQLWEDSEEDDDDEEEEEGFPQFIGLLCQNRGEEVSNDEWWREEFPDVWAQHYLDCGLVSGEVEVSGPLPPFQQQGRLSKEKEDVVADALPVLLASGVLVEGSSASNVPLEPTRKRDGRTWRLTLNCKALNKVTPLVEAQVLPDKINLISTLSPKSRYFSVVDLSNSAFAIPLTTSSRAKFAFTFRNRQYLFTRLPQGFHSTNFILQQRVSEMLSQLPSEDEPWVISYVDDILIAGRNQNETKARTRRVLKLIQKTGFKAKFEKAQLVRPKVDYLGLTIGAKGRGIQALKLESVLRAPSPQTVRGLRSLLGKFVSLQDHIPNYWELAQPLHRLTTKQRGWQWGPEQERALDRLKQAVVAVPFLRFPDKSQPFVIRLMPGKEAIGAALLQEDEEGQLVPVRHKSRNMKDHEASYVPEEKGCLAAVWAVQAFESLTGTAPIVIQLPHSPCKYLLRGEVLGSREPNQWTLLLVNEGEMAKAPQPQPSRTPVLAAPHLQLLPSHVSKANVWFTASEKTRCVGFAAANLEEQWLLGALEGGSVPGAELAALKKLLYHHHSSSPLYWYTGCWSLVETLQVRQHESEWGQRVSPCKGLWASILQWVHTNPGVLHVRHVGGDSREMEWKQKVSRRAKAMSGRAVGSQPIWEPSKREKQEIIAWCHSWSHEGAEGTLARVRRVASWEGDSWQVAHWVQNCLNCATGREGAGRVLPQREGGPWAQLQLGYISGLPETQEGLRSLLVVEDKFSGWVEAFPLGKEMVDAAATMLFSQIFGRYGTPHTIRLPHVPPFLRDAVAMAAFGLEPPWDIPQPGQATPATAALQRLAWGAGKSWATMLPLLLAGIRSIRAKGAALRPYQIIFGFPLEMRWGSVSPNDNVLPWLSRLEEDGDGYKHRTKAMLQGDCPEEDVPGL
uniref:ribonuclease H n=1 Tax=Athene cunicularia TaxID=194338 RepID=A0A663MEJ6_ATHCN